ncbi:ABC transporter permease [Endozoicomonas sp. G2_1]|uniref:ABC transporter permease n=1 Tax=Endozoicomonas sp. G2_1 TaxID=2821091 RepID=UPI001ADCA908|nr:ABC transporter permease [Endozoicomonas sp. G2_1]MBO9489847.1 ABC transporter permease [Endozoicomonas sp. G2_1]
MLPLSYILNGLTTRYKTTISLVLTISVLVFMVTALQMFSNSIQEVIVSSISPNSMIVTSQNATNEMSSVISDDQLDIAKQYLSANQIAFNENFVIIKYFKHKNITGGGNITIRGQSPTVFEYFTKLKIVEGRLPVLSENEVIVGKKVAERFQNMEVGDVLEFGNQNFVSIVGIFESENNSHESEIWGGIEPVRLAFGRNAVVSTLRFDNKGEHIHNAQLSQILTEQGLKLDLVKEQDFINKQAQILKIFIRIIGVVLCTFISVTALIVSHSIFTGYVVNRCKEIEIYRKIGFTNTAIISTFIIESIILGALGGIAGVILSFILPFFSISVFNISSYSQLVVGFSINAQIVLISILIGMLVGLISGLVPSIKISRNYNNYLTDYV